VEAWGVAVAELLALLCQPAQINSEPTMTGEIPPGEISVGDELTRRSS